MAKMTAKMTKRRRAALKAARTRRAVDTLMKEGGYDREIAKQVLAAASKKRIRGIYTKAQVNEIKPLSPEDKRDLEKVQNNEVLYPCFKCVEDKRNPEDCNHCAHGVYLGGPCSLCEQKARAARLPVPIVPETPKPVAPSPSNNVYWKVGV